MSSQTPQIQTNQYVPVVRRRRGLDGLRRLRLQRGGSKSNPSTSFQVTIPRHFVIQLGWKPDDVLRISKNSKSDTLVLEKVDRRTL